jgi:DNA-binding PucR family transcriptional regulator
MSILSTTDRVTALKNKTDKALSTFRRVAQDLTTINQQAEAEEKAKLVQAETLQKEAADLKILQGDNQRVVDNINRLLGVTS